MTRPSEGLGESWVGVPIREPDPDGDLSITRGAIVSGTPYPTDMLMGLPSWGPVSRVVPIIPGATDSTVMVPGVVCLREVPLSKVLLLFATGA